MNLFVIKCSVLPNILFKAAIMPFFIGKVYKIEEKKQKKNTDAGAKSDARGNENQKTLFLALIKQNICLAHVFVKRNTDKVI